MNELNSDSCVTEHFKEFFVEDIIIKIFFFFTNFVTFFQILVMNHRQA